MNKENDMSKENNKNTENKYKFCKLYTENNKDYVKFEILGKRQGFNDKVYVPKNPTIQVPLHMIKGVVKKLREEKFSTYNFAVAGNYYDTDNMVTMGALDYEVLFTDNVKLKYYNKWYSERNSYDSDRWIETNPIIDTKTGIKFYHIKKQIYLDLSDILDLNDKVVYSEKPETIDL